MALRAAKGKTKIKKIIVELKEAGPLYKSASSINLFIAHYGYKAHQQKFFWLKAAQSCSERFKYSEITYSTL